jgi:hypothetical protein
MTDNKHYVHDGIEVVKTGRTAKKSFKKQGTSSQKSIEFVLYEIKPYEAPGLFNRNADQEPKWVKWVKSEELYEIIEQNSNEAQPAE